MFCRAHRADQGSMPLALMLVSFLLIFATTVASTVAWQIAGNRSEATAHQAQWAIDSALNIAGENLGTTSSDLYGVPTTSPATWTKSPDSSYVYRWWAEPVQTYSGFPDAPTQGGQLGTGSGPSGFACAITTDATLKCWGDNRYGQLGNGTTTNSVTPVTVSGLSSVNGIWTGEFIACATVGAAKALYCWGRSDNYQLGTGYGTLPASQSTPVSASGLSGVTKVSFGDNVTCALLDTGAVYCWGKNTTAYMLGLTSATNSTIAYTPTKINFTGIATDLSLGKAAACLVDNAGALYCWGKNTNGERATGATDTSFYATPAVIASMSARPVKQIASALNGACALAVAGTIYCWGDNTYGQVGNGTQVGPVTTPYLISGTGWTSLVAGQSHYCATKSDSTVYCWGRAAGFGNGVAIGSATTAPTLMTTLSGYSITRITSGGYAAQGHCVFTTTAVSLCWTADNTWGQLGDGTTTTTTTPRLLPSIGSDSTQVTVRVQVKMVASPGKSVDTTTEAYNGGAVYYWNPATSLWTVQGFFPDLTNPGVVTITDAAQDTCGNVQGYITFTLGRFTGPISSIHIQNSSDTSFTGTVNDKTNAYIRLRGTTSDLTTTAGQNYMSGMIAGGSYQLEFSEGTAYTAGALQYARIQVYTPSGWSEWSPVFEHTGFNYNAPAC